MTNQRRFFQHPRLWGLLGWVTRVAAQLFALVGATIPAPMRTLRGIALRLLLAFAILLHMGLPEAQTAYADTQTAYTDTQTVYADTPGCSLTNGCPPATTFPAPELLYLKQGGLYAATAAQSASLRNIENQAIQTVLDLHSLPPADAAAVRTWGRDDVLAQLYVLLVAAINTSANQRTADQQNAVDWVTAVAKRRTVAAAEGAAREYVKWAGLGLGNFDALLRGNPTKAQLETFLSGPVVNFDNTNTALATEGWCVYRSPAPYADEYKGYNAPTCINPVIGISLPPTPTYDEFVKWGTAKANYPLWSSGAYLSRAQTLGIALGVLLPVAAIIAGYAPYSVAVAALATESAFKVLGTTAEITTILGATTSFLVTTGLTLVSTILVAVAAAIILGINVTDAANLPGKLATLVDTARATTPDAAALVSSSDAASNFLSLIIAVTTPTPSLDTCDNSKILAPGMYPLTIVGTDNTTLTSSTPCLNPSAIPVATATDTQFLVKAQRTGAETLSPSITVKDMATGNVTTARLSQTWFVATSNGQTVQSLRLSYTDWNNNQQNAWLIGDITTGNTFLTFKSSVSSGTTLSPKSCIADGTCGVTQSINYIGADDQQYSATLRWYQPPTGTPSVTAGVEGSPITLKANNFAPSGAVGPITYQWNFKAAFCNALSCNTVRTITGDPVDYIWQSPGTHQVDLVASDRAGRQATTRLQVPVSSLPPTLTFAPTCVGAPTATCNPWRGLIGVNLPLLATIGHAGTEDRLRITVNWGDGQQGTADISASDQQFMGDPMTITSAAGGLAYNLAATHRYASSGVYTGTVTVVNLVGLGGDGGTIVRTFSMTADLANTTQTLGTGGQYTAVALDSNRNPVISHFDDAQHALTVVHCGNAVCTSGNTSAVVDNTIGSTFYTSLKLDSSGNPVISYWDGFNNDLKLAHCGNPTCTSGNSVVTVDSAGNVGQFSSLALDSAGNPVISYHDGKTLDLKLARCGNPTCTSGNSVVTVDVGVNLGQYTSLALDSAGNPVISYYDFTNKDLKLVKCGNATCTAGNVFQTVDSAGAVGEHTALKLDSAGNPVISYYDATNTDLKVVKCGNATCSSGNVFQIVDRNGGMVGGYTSLQLDGSGRPVISYYDLTNQDLKLARCGNATCSSGNTIETPDSAGSVGHTTGLALDSNGNAVISYLDGTNHKLKLAWMAGPAAGGVAASAASVADPGVSAPSQPLTTTEVATAVDTAPAVVETTAPDTVDQSQRLFLPLVVKDANPATSASGADTTAAALPPAAVAAPAVITTTLPVAAPATVPPTQPLSPLAAAAPVTATVSVTVETAPLVTVTVPISAQVIVTALAVSETVAITTAQPVTTGTVGAAALDATAPAPTDTVGQSQNLFLPLIANASALAGAALGNVSGIALLALVVLVAVGIVWRRRTKR